MPFVCIAKSGNCARPLRLSVVESVLSVAFKNLIPKRRGEETAFSFNAYSILTYAFVRVQLDLKLCILFVCSKKSRSLPSCQKERKMKKQQKKKGKEKRRQDIKQNKVLLWMQLCLSNFWQEHKTDPVTELGKQTQRVGTAPLIEAVEPLRALCSAVLTPDVLRRYKWEVPLCHEHRGA